VAAHWIIPSNGNTFDTASAFKSLSEINWSEVGNSTIAVGDVVYLYSSQPASAITHKCVVTATRLRREAGALAERIGSRSWMRLRLQTTFDSDTSSHLALDALQSNGLKGNMAGRQRLQSEPLEYIQRVEDLAGAGAARSWWVNQGVTGVTTSSFGGVPNLWAANLDAQGNTQPSWESVDQAAPGDVVLHYVNGFVVGSSRVASRSRAAIRPQAFETTTRTGDEGRELLLEDFALFDIPVLLDEIPIELRISEGGPGSPFTVDGRVRRGFLFALRPSIMTTVFDLAGLVGDVVEGSGLAGGGGETERYLAIDTTDGAATVKYRKEQGALRKRLFGSATRARCGLCGRLYPVRYLHTAHIKSRYACSEAERKDWQNVVMPACLFGCDALFEDGMLTVDAGGVIHAGEGRDETTAFAAFTGSLDGKAAIGFTAANRKYFEWCNGQARQALAD
jgi:hypothetical protein